MYAGWTLVLTYLLLGTFAIFLLSGFAFVLTALIKLMPRLIWIDKPLGHNHKWWHLVAREQTEFGLVLLECARSRYGKIQLRILGASGMLLFCLVCVVVFLKLRQ